MYGLIMLTVILALVFTLRKAASIKNMKWLQRLVLDLAGVPGHRHPDRAGSPPKLGRQPWVVYPSATGPEGVSARHRATRHLGRRYRHPSC